MDSRYAERRLIIHGDDLGISESVNLGISEAHRNGVLTSASIMAVGAAFEHAVDVCNAQPSLDVGVHLTLIEERPLLSPHDVPSLVDFSERFHGAASTFTRRYFGDRINLVEVYQELDAQIRRVRHAGLTVTHLDSHQHVHMLPGIFDVTCRLAREHSIPAVRIPNERLTVGLVRRAPSLSRVLQQRVLSGFCWVNSRRIGSLRRTDHFAGFLFGGDLNQANLKTVLHSLPSSGCTEIMCHPSVSNTDGNYAHWGYNGVVELEALLDQAMPSFLSNLGFELVAYPALAESQT